MTDTTPNDKSTSEVNPTNRPDLYIQKRTWENGKTVYKKLGVIIYLFTNSLGQNKKIDFCLFSVSRKFEKTRLVGQKINPGK